MFRAVLTDSNILRSSIPIIAEIIDEGVFIVDQNGISLLSPDRTMVSVVDFKVLSSAFEEFKVEGKESIGLNMANFSSVLKRAGSGKLVLESGKSKLLVKISGSGIRTFELPLIDVRVEKPPIEQLSFSASVEMNSNVFEEGVTDAELIGDAIVLEAEAGSFKMAAKGETSSTEMKIKAGEGGLLNIRAQQPVRAQYPLDYLKKMIKASKLSPQVLVEFGKDYPMRISFKAIDKVNLSFILAPRVSEE